MVNASVFGKWNGSSRDESFGHQMARYACSQELLQIYGRRGRLLVKDNECIEPSGTRLRIRLLDDDRVFNAFVAAEEGFDVGERMPVRRGN